MKTDLAPTLDINVMRRADLPVIWDDFKAKAEALRVTAETIVVVAEDETDKMELARTTRLTLKQIRIAVEKKRVELGEGHLTEIQKINGAAKALKELIEPLESRLLVQENFAERAAADRLVELTKRRNDEVRAIWPGCPGDFGKMPQTEYDALLGRLRAEAALMAEEKRKQEEAKAQAETARKELEAKLAEQQAEAQRQAKAAAAEAEARLANERAELQRQNERVRQEYEAERARETESRRAQAELEKKERDAREAVVKAEFEAAESRRRLERQAEEAKRLELEHQLAIERAAKLEEERRLFKLAIAPDVEQLAAFSKGIFSIPQPDLKTPEAKRVLDQASHKLVEAMLILDVFCADEI